jgi:hypothetical protein
LGNERRVSNGPESRRSENSNNEEGESPYSVRIVILANGRVQKSDLRDQRVERIVASSGGELAESDLGGCDLREKLIKRLKGDLPCHCQSWTGG